jgi:hypothetical protein
VTVNEKLEALKKKKEKGGKMKNSRQFVIHTVSVITFKFVAYVSALFPTITGTTRKTSQ